MSDMVVHDLLKSTLMDSQFQGNVDAIINSNSPVTASNPAPAG